MEVAGKEVPGSRGNDRQGHAGPCERFGYRADGTVTTGDEHGIRTGVERLLRRKLTQVIDCRLEKQRGSPARGRRFALDRGADGILIGL